MGSRARAGSWWGATALTALLMGLGHTYANINADGLIPVLVSTQHWTPFYWGQNRLGMLLPLLALPFRAPVTNLVVQGLLADFGTVGAFLLTAAYVVRRASAPLAGALCAALFFALAPPLLIRESVPAQPYGISLALGIAALWLLRPKRGWRGVADPLLALVLTALAYWVNNALFILLVPVALTRFACALAELPRAQVATVLRRRPDPAVVDLRGELLRALALELVAATVSTRILQQLPDGNPYFVVLPARAWMGAWATLGHIAWTTLSPSAWPIALGVLLAAGVALQLSPWARATRRSSLIALLGLALAALALFLAAGTNEWVRRNLFATRYILPGLWLLALGIALLWDGVVAEWLKSRSWGLPALGTAALVAMALGRFGPPGMSTVRRDLAEATPAGAELLVDAHVTHLTGDYWRVWPLVIQANQLLHERGEARQIWGITTRSETTQALWSSYAPSELVLACPERDQGMLRYAAGALRSGAMDVERREGFLIARPKPAMAVP